LVMPSFVCFVCFVVDKLFLRFAPIVYCVRPCVV
jgi:hypothetical protein